MKTRSFNCVTGQQVLPDFREVSGDRKFEPLLPAEVSEDPDAEILWFLQSYAQLDRKAHSNFRVLDFGCGRGVTVGRLRRLGWMAFGVEIEPRFISAGAIIDHCEQKDFPLLSLVDRDGRTVFPDGYFDAVISDQVLEHVCEINAVAREMSRVLRREGRVFHRLPGKYLLMEPHYRLPLVHWFPKNESRRRLIRALLEIGWSVPLPESMSTAQKTDVIYQYSCEHTYYRSPAEIAAAFSGQGIVLDLATAQRQRVRRRLRRYRVPTHVAAQLSLLPGLSSALGRFRDCLMTGRKLA